jgi:hypothetical protein
MNWRDIAPTLVCLLFSACSFEATPAPDAQPGVIEEKRLGLQPLESLPGLLDNTEFAADPWTPSHGRRRGWVFLGICSSTGWHKRPALDVPSCTESWSFPLDVKVSRDSWVHNRSALGDLQVGRIKQGDQVTVHEINISNNYTFETWAPLMAEIEFPDKRSTPCR